MPKEVQVDEAPPEIKRGRPTTLKQSNDDTSPQIETRSSGSSSSKNQTSNNRKNNGSAKGKDDIDMDTDGGGNGPGGGAASTLRTTGGSYEQRASPSNHIVATVAAVNMTNATTTTTMTNRPLSTASNGSSAGASSSPPPPPPPPQLARTTTATSRRGGRTRSRSPTSGMTRSPSTSPVGLDATHTTGPDAAAATTTDAGPVSNKDGVAPLGVGIGGSAAAATASDSGGSSGSSTSPTAHQQRRPQQQHQDHQQQHQPSPMSPANPSAAAAAAAAAAKSLRRSHHQPPPPSSWYGGDPSSASAAAVAAAASMSAGRYGGSGSSGGGNGPPPPSNRSRYGAGPGGGGPPPPHLRGAPAGYYDHHGPPPPPSYHHHHRYPLHSYDGRPPSRSGGPHPPPPPQGGKIDRYGYRPSGPSSGPGGGPGGDPYSYRSGGRPPYGQYPHGHGGGGHPLPSHYDGDYGRRPYGGGVGGPPPPPPPTGRGGPFPGSTPSPHGRPGSATPGNTIEDGAAGTSTPVKPTRRVIGTATPIHVPRATDSSNGQTPIDSSRGTSNAASKSADSRRGSAASVFRRSNSTTSDGAKTGASSDKDDKQQKILMALQSPTNSFEEKKSSEPGISSPKDPPQIQRSPTSSAGGPPHHSNSLDMAPSFSLFNQSFDSLGDAGGFFNVGGPLDSALQSTSFGGAASLDDKALTDLQLTASNGTFKLGASSSGGALTFGMSPTNSFGNGPISSSRSGNIFLLGGQDHGAASPSQVLDIYRTTSVSSPRTKMDDGVGSGQLRLSGSLLASPSLGNYSMRGSFGGEVPPSMPPYQGYHHHPPPHHLGLYHRSNPFHRPRRSTAPAPDGAPGFYVFLRNHRHAFRDVTFLLPGVKAYVMDARNQAASRKGDNDATTPKRQTHRDRRTYDEPLEHESNIAQRRVVSAVCAFGGTFVGSRIASSGPPKPAESGGDSTNSKAQGGSQSIFRNNRGDPASVTPNASATSAVDRSGDQVSRQRFKYDEALPGRYYENDNRLSWEFEENPPVAHGDKDDDEDPNDNKRDGKGGGSGKNSNDPNNKHSVEDDDQDEGSGEEGDEEGKKSGDKGKMRYRCKLCGQPKTDHVCPYKQSLVRNIGTMVYPAVNAFSASEPGKLAPSLSDMNNFTSGTIGEPGILSAENSPSRPTPDRARRALTTSSSSSMAQVTPEALRSGTPRSSAASTGTESGPATPQRSSRGTASRRGTPGSSRSKRSHAQMSGDGNMEHTDLLFVEATELKPEQFRMVTPSNALLHRDAYTYPTLPLPYAQRKRLSDNLFSLSKEIPQLTDECAAVLREARERDMWDLAVAELMTQVVVVVHCHDNDMVFEGLRRYLLTLGVSC